MSCRKKVIDVAAGSTHCLALTEDSEVHSWRSNDQCQHFDTLRVTKPEPAALPGLDAKHIVGITCGPAQVLNIEVDLVFWRILDSSCSLSVYRKYH
ncbi:E3 ubiquitin-protein ligase HERC2-like [Pongo pygmaeus]|uniref:E3 ubiquitin-protein ligase HERC2-like n=1 Tax=Pongo pygmaeus TaxID=9600 RepID=UPI0023E8CA36|nr:E3 ubiquitin-protein ligase HERC2-like [Pongo abelii]